MIPIPTGVRVWLATGYTDMRKDSPPWRCRFKKCFARTLWVAIYSAFVVGAAIC